MVRNPFNVDIMTVDKELREELIDLQNDHNCKDNYNAERLEVFWFQKTLANPRLRNIAIIFFSPLSAGIFNLSSYKNKASLKVIKSGIGFAISTRKKHQPPYRHDGEKTAVAAMSSAVCPFFLSQYNVFYKGIHRRKLLILKCLFSIILYLCSLSHTSILRPI